MRRNNWKRCLKDFGEGLGPYVVRFLLNIIWRTCKVIQIDGEEGLQALLNSKTPFIPVYWHQHHIYGAYLMLRLQKKGANLGFLISPSADGDLAAKIPQSWGMMVIRGSSTNTGAKALRNLYQVMMKDNISPVNTSDGPVGPLHVFKPGAIMLAQLTQKKLVPVSYAASRYWETKAWDKFVIPKPFSKIAICIGKPVDINKTLSKEELEENCELMRSLLLALQESARQALQT